MVFLVSPEHQQRRELPLCPLENAHRAAFLQARCWVALVGRAIGSEFEISPFREASAFGTRIGRCVHGCAVIEIQPRTWNVFCAIAPPLELFFYVGRFGIALNSTTRRHPSLLHIPISLHSRPAVSGRRLSCWARPRIAFVSRPFTTPSTPNRPTTRSPPSASLTPNSQLAARSRWTAAQNDTHDHGCCCTRPSPDHALTPVSAQASLCQRESCTHPPCKPPY